MIGLEKLRFYRLSVFFKVIKIEDKMEVNLSFVGFINVYYFILICFIEVNIIRRCSFFKLVFFRER